MIQVSNLVIYSELPGFIITVCGPSSVILSVSALIKNRPLWWSLSSLTVKQGEKLKKSWRWSLQNAQHIHKYTQKMGNKTMEATWSKLCKDFKNEMNFVLDIGTFIFHRSTASQTSWREYLYSQPTSSQNILYFYKTLA